MVIHTQYTKLFKSWHRKVIIEDVAFLNDDVDVRTVSDIVNWAYQGAVLVSDDVSDESWRVAVDENERCQTPSASQKYDSLAFPGARSTWEAHWLVFLKILKN